MMVLSSKKAAQIGIRRLVNFVYFSDDAGYRRKKKGFIFIELLIYTETQEIQRIIEEK